MIIRDESHIEKGPSSTATMMVREIRKRQGNKIPVWFYSGTVCKGSPQDLCGVTEVLEDEAIWDADPTFQRCRSTQLAELGKAFKRASANMPTSEKTELVERASLVLRRQSRQATCYAFECAMG